VVPILTAGDTLVSSVRGEPPFIFPGRASGTGLRLRDRTVAEVFVTHRYEWFDNREGGLVSRLLLDTSNAGVLAADCPLTPDDGYEELGAALLADDRVGFLKPAFLVGEDAVDTPRGGVVAAFDARTGGTAPLPWLGRMSWSGLAALPLSGGSVALVAAGGYTAGRYQVFLYLADSDADLLAGRGQLYVLRVAGAFGRSSARSASEIPRIGQVGGSLVPLEREATRDAVALQRAADQAAATDFVRLGGIAVDRERSNSFYFVDAGGNAVGRIGFTPAGPGSGRLYRVELDPFDPTTVREVSVVLDGNDGDDLYRPTDIDTDPTCVMIQEAPGGHGLRTARVLRYDVRTRRLEAVAECAEQDRKGRVLPRGVGGEWESSGIRNASDVFGDDTWLVTVQAHTLRTRSPGGRIHEDGQILLLRGSRWRPPAKPKAQ
jgi:hypothetical protein